MSKSPYQRKKAIVVKYNCCDCPDFISCTKHVKYCLAVDKPILEDYIPDWCPLDDLMTVVRVETTCLDGEKHA